MGIAGIYKRGGVYWFRTDPITGGRASSGKRDKRAAELEFRRRERLVASPGDTAAEAAQLGEWAAHMVASKQRNKAARTAEYYAQKVGHWVRIFGADAPLSAITPQSVMLYLDQRREEGASELTLDKELVAITQTLKLARHARVYNMDPRELRPPDFSGNYKARTRFLLPAEAKKLLDVLTPQRAAHVAFFLGTGARLSEASAAQAGDIDWKAGTVFLRGTKTAGARRRVPILKHTISLLRLAEPWLPFAPWVQVQRDLAVACRHAGIEKVSPNDLRRTTATWLVEAGVSFDLIAKVLGHTTTQMLHRVYGQARTTKLRDLIDAEVDASTGTDVSQFLAELNANPIDPPRTKGDAGGSSTGFLNRWSEVRLLSGAPLLPQETGNPGPPRTAPRRVDSYNSVTSQGRHSAAAWSLALAAESLGLGRVA